MDKLAREAGKCILSVPARGYGSKIRKNLVQARFLLLLDCDFWFKKGYVSLDVLSVDYQVCLGSYRFIDWSALH